MLDTLRRYSTCDAASSLVVWPILLDIKSLRSYIPQSDNLKLQITGAAFILFPFSRTICLFIVKVKDYDV
ncbi:hypothetical protein OPV22_012927 [Ensete ventricosum]|uniref:Uncharacterized protein n=1 Tax=Ensete ventricosum TaxID=4639 RepID=A0AAV8R8K7_ENSVE|nr:hypothetical protein OPV22_012927 [Ensete ventricosum]